MLSMRKGWCFFVVKRLSKILLFSIVLVIVLSVKGPAKAYAFNVTSVDMAMYATSGTPVYATPDISSKVVVYIDRHCGVKVTGITDNGFYRVDLNGAYYIPGPYMVASVTTEKTQKQIALENLKKYAEAYKICLEHMSGYSTSFGLKDVTGDGIPEIFDKAGQEIYTYHNERMVMLYYSPNVTTFYYSAKDNVLIGKYTWNGTNIWEVYNKDTSILPWGQFKCVSTAASAYQKNATEITREYTNDEATRNNMYNILKGIMSL